MKVGDMVVRAYAFREFVPGIVVEEKREKITAMLAERAPYYRRAHITVRSSEDRRPVDTVTELLDLLQRRAKC